ncbi:hypothetical protein CIPAW_04G145200 [Carya illinoinensis]|uniref:Uncharacterized protein n=2 Tax=Carya illinoinensis TaxID=32201 RepID=A0A8T1QVQ3_CARIL|nr:hypothetical protein CIPAW_04G145200 [Carya illinoinensis]
MPRSSSTQKHPLPSSGHLLCRRLVFLNRKSILPLLSPTQKTEDIGFQFPYQPLQFT